MTREDCITALISYAGDDYDTSQDLTIEHIVDDAISETAAAMHPWPWEDEATKTEFEEKALLLYPAVIRRISEHHYDRIGREGATAWKENDQSVSYASGGTPAEFFNSITPYTQII